MSEERKLNPEIKTIDVGTRQLRSVHVYPLSVGDQLDITDRLMNTITSLSEGKSSFESNEEAIEFLRKIITENLGTILEYVTDDGERPTFNEMTNNQFYQIANIIFEVNYEAFVKNCLSLIERAKEILNQQKG